MNTAISTPGFYADRRCRRHYRKACAVCRNNSAPAPLSRIDSAIVRILELLPDEDAWHDLRVELLRVKLNAGKWMSFERTRMVFQLVDFHVALSVPGAAPWRFEVHHIAEELHHVA